LQFAYTLILSTCMQQFLFLQIIHYNKEIYEHMREIIEVSMQK